MDFYHPAHANSETFHCYFWRKYRVLLYGETVLVLIGLLVVCAGNHYSYTVTEPICGCEIDKDYCCPQVFNNPTSGVARQCHANECFCYQKKPYQQTTQRSGDVFCMPLEQSQSFETAIVHEPSPLLLFVGYLVILVGMVSLTGICWTIPCEHRTYDALEVQKEMEFLESRISVAAAALKKTPPQSPPTFAGASFQLARAEIV